MFNREKTITLGSMSEFKRYRKMFPEASLTELASFMEKCNMEDILECQEAFPLADAQSILMITRGRDFNRWCEKNSRIVLALTALTPVFALTMFNALPGSVFFDWLLKPSIAYSTLAATSEASVVAAFSTATIAAPVSTSFWGGKGAILLHMLVAGFFTLVVSSFLKFTGRGDLIPLVAFVGGAIILYEVIGLFNDIYGAIRTLMSM